MSNIDYRKPFDNDAYFQEYLKTKEKKIKQTSQKATQPTNSHMWAIVFVLMVSLVSLGVVALLQYRELQNRLANINQSVAGVKETATNTQNIISSDSMSIVIDTKTPEAFKLDRQVGNSTIIDGLPNVTTTLLAEVSDEQNQLVSGISIEVIEYDNKMDRAALANKVSEYLGEDFEVISENVSIPKDIQLTKIERINTEPESTYYVAVTSQNYYIITMYNQTADNPDYSEISRFTDLLLQNLYLN